MTILTILPLDKSLSFIRSLAETDWPLTSERVHDIARQVGWDLAITDEYFSYQSFDILADIHGSMTLHSYGVPQVSFNVSEYARGDDKEQKIARLVRHMMALEKELRGLYGNAYIFTTEWAEKEFRWWRLPSGVWVKIEYGGPRATVTINGPRNEYEPEDRVLVPSVQACMRTIQTWVEASWPLPVSSVHSIAESLGWGADDVSSSAFFSNFLHSFFEANPYYYTEDFFAVPDVDVDYGQRGATKISFPLADHWSMRTEAQAWQLMWDRMLEVEAALSTSYGPPERGRSWGGRHYAKWMVIPHLSVTTFRGAGMSDVTIEFIEPEDLEPSDIPVTYEVDEVLGIIDEWTGSMHSLDLFEAGEIATGLGWSPENPDWPDTFYTRVSPPGQARAAIKGDKQQLWLVTFDVAMGIKEDTPGHSAADIERVMTALEAALETRYGHAEARSHYGGEYRDWDTGQGARVRIGYGLGMSSVWIYDPAKRSTVDTFITRPAQPETAKAQPAPAVWEKTGSETAKSSSSGRGPSMSKVAFSCTFLAVLGAVLAYFFF